MIRKFDRMLDRLEVFFRKRKKEAVQEVDELINKEVNNGFFLKALELIEQLPTLPVELQAEALKAEMEAIQ